MPRLSQPDSELLSGARLAIRRKEPLVSSLYLETISKKLRAARQAKPALPKSKEHHEFEQQMKRCNLAKECVDERKDFYSARKLMSLPTNSESLTELVGSLFLAFFASGILFAGSVAKPNLEKHFGDSKPLQVLAIVGAASLIIMTAEAFVKTAYYSIRSLFFDEIAERIIANSRKGVKPITHRILNRLKSLPSDVKEGLDELFPNAKHSDDLFPKL